MTIDAEQVESLQSEGLTASEIAVRLDCSHRTIMRKLSPDQKLVNKKLMQAKKDAEPLRRIHDLLIDNPSASVADLSLALDKSTVVCSRLLSLVVEANAGLWVAQCETCGAQMKQVYGEGRFCKAACARAFSSAQITDAGKERRNAALVAPETRAKIAAYQRENPRVWTDDQRKAMSIMQKERMANPALRAQLSRAMKAHLDSLSPEERAMKNANTREGMMKAIAEGRHKGWRSRNVLSYPEKVWSEKLAKAGLQFETNKPVGKLKLDGSQYCYFLDFVLTNERGELLDLEIDGKQHQYEERRASDEVRDAYLTSLGYTIVRAPWYPRQETELILSVVRSVEDSLTEFFGFEVDLGFCKS